MAVKSLNYSKEFTSVTSYHDVSRHGSPELHPHQENSPEDETIRERIIEKFGLFELEKRFGFGEYFGSDGNMNYTFNFIGYLNAIEENPEKNIPYKTHISIKKSGDGQRLEELSDIERFVLDKGFEKAD